MDDGAGAAAGAVAARDNRMSSRSISHYKSDAGFSVVEAMIAAALMSVVIMSMIVLANHMTSNVQRSTVEQDADNILANVKSMIATPGVCDSLFVGVNWSSQVSMINPTKLLPPPPLVWENFTTLPNLGPQYPVGVPLPNANNLTIKSIELRDPYTCSGSPVAMTNPWSEGNCSKSLVSTAMAPSTDLTKTSTYVSVNAILDIEFSLTAPLTGEITHRIAPVTVAVNLYGGGVDFCFDNRKDLAANYDCKKVTLPSPNPCTAAPANIYITPTYYVAGFDASGTPICACKLVSTPTPWVWNQDPLPPGKTGYGAYLPGGLCGYPIPPYTAPAPAGKMCFNVTPPAAYCHQSGPSGDVPYYCGTAPPPAPGTWQPTGSLGATGPPCPTDPTTGAVTGLACDYQYAVCNSGGAMYECK